MSTNKIQSPKKGINALNNIKKITRSSQSIRLLKSPSVTPNKRANISEKYSPYFNSFLDNISFSHKKPKEPSPSKSRQKTAKSRNNSLNKILKPNEIQKQLSRISLFKRQSAHSEDKKTPEATKGICKLEVKLKQMLDEISSSDLEEKKANTISAYENIFEKIIKKDKNFGSILSKVKTGLDHKVNNYKQKLKQENRQAAQSLSTQLKNYQTEKKVLSRKLEKLAVENSQLRQQIEAREEQLLDVQSRYLEIGEIDLEKVPRNQDSWDQLMGDNKFLSEACQDMRNKLKVHFFKEKKLMKFLKVIKEKGYPVEELLESNSQLDSESTQHNPFTGSDFKSACSSNNE